MQARSAFFGRTFPNADENPLHLTRPEGQFGGLDLGRMKQQKKAPVTMDEGRGLSANRESHQAIRSDQDATTLTGGRDNSCRPGTGTVIGEGALGFGAVLARGVRQQLAT